MAAAASPDGRDPGCIQHGMDELLAQRIYGLCCGHEDMNEHSVLRNDVLMQTAVGSDVMRSVVGDGLPHGADAAPR